MKYSCNAVVAGLGESFHTSAIIIMWYIRQHYHCIYRQYIYDEREKQFMPLSSLTFHNKCILCVSHFFHVPLSQHPDSVPCTSLAFLCSTATDGRVAIWSLEGILCQWMLQRSLSSTNDQGGLDRLAATIRPNCIIEAHQSGVNAISICSMGV